jgi:hypothetical protein
VACVGFFIGYPPPSSHLGPYKGVGGLRGPLLGHSPAARVGGGGGLQGRLACVGVQEAGSSDGEASGPHAFMLLGRGQTETAGSTRPMTAMVVAAVACGGQLVRACGGGLSGLLVRVHGSQGFLVGLMAPTQVARW